MKHCHAIGKTLDFGPSQIMHCGCPAGNLRPPVVCEFSGGKFPLDVYIDSVHKLIKENNSESPPCGPCHHLKEYDSTEEAVVNIPLVSLTINTVVRCNLRCVYCGWLSTQSDTHLDAYDVTDTLINMLEQGIVTTSTSVAWGGGEPTISKHFEKCCDFLIENNIPQRLHSNGTVYSNAIAKGLSKNLITIVTSIDAGTRETYSTVKGADLFNNYWDNIKRYAEVNNEKVIVKYIILSGNCDLHEFLEFTEQCCEAGVTKVEITPEFGSLFAGTYKDEFVYGMAVLHNLLISKGIEVSLMTMFYNDDQIKIIDSFVSNDPHIITSLRMQIDATQSKLDTETRKLNEILVQLEEKKELIPSLQHSIKAFEQSTSWRITKPLRFIKHLIIQK